MSLTNQHHELLSTNCKETTKPKKMTIISPRPMMAMPTVMTAAKVCASRAASPAVPLTVEVAKAVVIITVTTTHCPFPTHRTPFSPTPQPPRPASHPPNPSRHSPRPSTTPSPVILVPRLPLPLHNNTPPNYKATHPIMTTATPKSLPNTNR